MLGFGQFTYPARKEAPVAATPLASPFADFGGSGQAWESDWQRRYDEEAAKYRPATGSMAQLIPGAEGYNAAAAAPWHEQIKGTLGQIFDSTWGMNLSGHTPEQADTLRNSYILKNMSTYMEPAPGAGGGNRGSHIVTTPDYDPGYTPDFSLLNAERERLAPLAEQQMRQQQAYDWMEGAHQQNAIMSPEYANAGFNTITGMSNPYAGPGRIDGVSMDWAQGVYDPTTQRGTGTYNPTNYSKNIGW